MTRLASHRVFSGSTVRWNAPPRTCPRLAERAGLVFVRWVTPPLPLPSLWVWWGLWRSALETLMKMLQDEAPGEVRKEVTELWDDYKRTDSFRAMALEQKNDATACAPVPLLGAGIGAA